jgi:predicted NBD/HSP70 family sugar kinase
VPSAGVANLRRDNAALVARAVFDEPGVSRSDLVEVTGLSAGAVTKIVSHLLSQGVVREGEPTNTSVGGRPRVPLRPSDEPYRVIGIHIGLRWLVGALADLGGTIVHEETVAHRSTKPGPVLDGVAALVDRLEAVAGRSHVVAAGLSTAGWVDSRRQVVVANPAIGWVDVDLRPLLARRRYATHVDSTVRALASAESRFGTSRGVDDSVQVFVGNFVGSAASHLGVIQRGSHQAAGLVDHLPVGAPGPVRCRCGRSDCFGVLATDLAVAEQARRDGLIGESGQIEDLLELWRSGDRGADRLLRRRAVQVGRAVGLLANLYDPDTVVVSGHVAQQQHLADLHKGAAERLERADIVSRLVHLTGLGEHALTRAPAAVALAAFYQDPLGALGALGPV